MISGGTTISTGHRKPSFTERPPRGSVGKWVTSALCSHSSWTWRPPTACCGLDSARVKVEEVWRPLCPNCAFCRGEAKALRGEMSHLRRSGWDRVPGADSQTRGSFLSDPGLGLSKMAVSFPSASIRAETLAGRLPGRPGAGKSRGVRNPAH